MPSAMSSASEPVETAPTATCGRSLMRMTEPLPNCRSICPSATSSASSRFMSSSSRLSKLLWRKLYGKCLWKRPSEHDSSTSYRAPDGCRRERKAAAPDGANGPVSGSGGARRGRSRNRRTVTCGSHGRRFALVHAKRLEPRVKALCEACRLPARVGEDEHADRASLAVAHGLQSNDARSAADSSREPR